MADVSAFINCAAARPVTPSPAPLDLTALRDAVFTPPTETPPQPGGRRAATEPADLPGDGLADGSADAPDDGSDDGSDDGPDDALDDEVTRLWAEWQNSAEPYSGTLRRLPVVLRALGATLGEVAAHAHRLACQLAGRIGDRTLALAAAQHAVVAARGGQCGCTPASALGTYAETLAHLGILASAEAARDVALRTLEGCGCQAHPAVAGRLHLVAARIATAGNAAHAARRWLAKAAEYAQEPIPDDPRHPFGDQDVAVQAVRVALRLGDLPDALRLSDHVEPENMPGRARRSRGYIALACVHARARTAPGTILALGKAEQACAEELRINRCARQTISDLLSRDNAALVRAEAWALAARTGLA